MSELHRFGINEETSSKEWRAAVEKLLIAFLTNPHLNVGNSNSEIVFPVIPVPRKSTAAAEAVAAASACFFGEIIVVGADTFIRGGVVSAGDKTYNVPNYQLTLGTPIDKLVSLKFDVEVWRDDDNEVLMPGVKTSAETDASTFWDLKTWTLGTDYDDDTAPTVTTGIGTVVIPLGRLTIADGAATFAPTGCGNVTVGHCGGTLSHVR